MFDALRVEDVKKFDSVIAPGFHMFDGGIRCRNAVIDFIKAQPVAGNRHEWNVTDPDVHIRSNIAWIAYVRTPLSEIASVTLKEAAQEQSSGQERCQNTWCRMLSLHD